jgi:arginase
LISHENRTIALFGAPLDSGASVPGADGGPAALRAAGIGEALLKAGYDIEDFGDLAPIPVSGLASPNPVIKNLDQAAGWTRRLMPFTEALLANGCLPLCMGGDHSLSLGTVAGAAAYAQSVNRPLYVLWLDAHPDFNTLETTETGNLHGVPAAFFCGLPGFDAVLGAPLAAPVDPANMFMVGIRSVDVEEMRLVKRHGVRAHGMAALRDYGVTRLLSPFLNEVAEAGGLLHVSFDVDFLDPAVAPAVGTPAVEGACIRETQRIMELVRESGLMTSLDIVELNPRLDENNRTARMVVDLAGDLFGRKAANRPFVAHRLREHFTTQRGDA